MPEVNIPYELVGPDGTRVVFNDPNDIDHIGWLDGDRCSGLEGPNTRESVDLVVEGDGGVHGTFYRDRRFPVLAGIIDPNVDMSTLNFLESKLKRATRGLAADCTLSWTPTGDVKRRLFLRRAAGNSLQIVGRRPKQFQVSMVSASSNVLSSAENSQSLDASSISGEIGFVSPITSPFSSGWSVAAQVYVLNRGDDNAPWRMRIDGPMVNPRIVNNTLGLELKFAITLNSGDSLFVDALAHTVLLGGTSDRYSTLDFTASTWWLLAPGNNDIRLLPTSSSSPARIVMYWHDAYE